MKSQLVAWLLLVPVIVGTVSADVVEQKIREAEVFKAAKENDAATLTRLVALDKSLADARDSAKATPLIRAAEAGALAAVQVLVKNGADLYAFGWRTGAASSSDKPPASFAYTPLIAAIQRTSDSRTVARINNAEAIIIALVKAGYEINLRDSQSGGTALHFAVLHDAAKSTVQLLLQEKADVRSATKEGDTPLHFVKRQDVAELLLRSGADGQAKNRNGEVPAESVVSRGDVDLARFLVTATKSPVKNPLPGPAQPAAPVPAPAPGRQLPLAQQIKLFVSTGKERNSSRKYLAIQIKNQGMNQLTSISVTWKNQGCSYNDSGAQTLNLKPMETQEIRTEGCYGLTGYLVEVFVDGQLAASDRR